MPLDKKTISEALEMPIKFIPLITGTSFALALSYDFSWCCLGVGISFNEVATNLSDHIRTCVVFVPFMVMHAYLLIVASMLGSAAYSKSISCSPHILSRISSRILKFTPHVSAAVAFAAMMCIYYMSSYGLRFILWLAASFGFATLLGYAVKSISKELVFLLLIIVLISVPVLGFYMGKAMYGDGKAHWECRIADEKEFRQLSGIRRFSTSAVMVDPKGGISVMPDSRILELRRVNPK